MKETNRTSNTVEVPPQTVVSRTVYETLTPEEIHHAFTILFEKMKVPDPANPNLWTVQINGRRLWGILDEGAGTDGQNLVSLIYPEDY